MLSAGVAHAASLIFEPNDSKDSNGSKGSRSSRSSRSRTLSFESSSSGRPSTRTSSSRSVDQFRSEPSEIVARTSGERKRREVVQRTIGRLGIRPGALLTRRQLTQMLTQYSMAVVKRPVRPSHDDIDFIIALCDAKGGDGNGSINGREIIAAGEVWHAYLDRAGHVLELLRLYDIDRSGSIDVLELHQMFKSLNVSKHAVPIEVTRWIFRQASPTGHNSIAGVELARALVMWYMWSGGADPAGPAYKLQDFIEDWPETNKGPCCTIC